MGLLIGTRRALLGGRVAYWQQIINDYNPTRYWPLWDTAGAAAQELIAADAGTYVGPTLADALNPNGLPCPRFDGVNDRVQIALPANTFPGVFDGDHGSAIIAARVFNLGVWTDGARRIMFRYGVDGNNQIIHEKQAVNNQIRWRYEAGGVVRDLARAGENTVQWFTIGITWNRVANRVTRYWNGVQEGVVDNHPAAWVGVIDNGDTAIGAQDGNGPVWWNGWLSDNIAWAGVELAGPQMLDISNLLRAI